MCKGHLFWWTDPHNLDAGVSFTQQIPVAIVTTDASLLVWWWGQFLYRAVIKMWNTHKARLHTGVWRWGQSSHHFKPFKNSSLKVQYPSIRAICSGMMHQQTGRNLFLPPLLRCYESMGMGHSFTLLSHSNAHPRGFHCNCRQVWQTNIAPSQMVSQWVSSLKDFLRLGSSLFSLCYTIQH